MAADTLPEFHCYRCIYSWTPRRIPVRMCPRCKSRLWDQPVVRMIATADGKGPGDVLGPYRKAVVALARKYGAKRVRVFGSVRRQAGGPQSDLDLLVDDLPRASVLDVARLEVELSRLLGRSVDVVEEGALPWSIRPQVLAEALPI